MDIEKPIQVPAHSDALIEGQFFVNNMLTRLVLYPEFLYFCNDDVEYTYAITFDFCFDIIRQSSGWVLTITGTEQMRFYSVLDLDEWENVLMKLMKRRRFHELYKGVKKIGKGNFASVYLTQRVKDSKLFAVKAFHKEHTFKPTNGKQGLQNEINILRQLSHPNISHLEGVFESENSIYLVMELIQGKSLGDILDQQKMLSPIVRKKIIKGILSALAQMQSKNIVHRDIKPENIMINPGNEAKIVDFGLATNTHTLNYLYIRCGTPGFVAPEILTIRDTENARMNTISDVFSAGALLYQMIFGKALFDGQKNNEILQKNRKCHFNIPTSSDLASYEELSLLRRMLEVSPDTRINASQALKSNFFADSREPLKEITLSHPNPTGYHNKYIPPFKYAQPIRHNKLKKMENNEN